MSNVKEHKSSSKQKNIMFEIIDENLNISNLQLKNMVEDSTISSEYISDISQKIELSINKINNNSRFEANKANHTDINISHLQTIANNRQHRFESRLSWNKDSKANDINSQRIEERKRKILEKKQREIDVKKQIELENKVKKLDDKRKKLEEEKRILDEMQKEDKRATAIEELFAIRRENKVKKYATPSISSPSIQQERSA